MTLKQHNQQAFEEAKKESTSIWKYIWQVMIFHKLDKDQRAMMVICYALLACAITLIYLKFM